MDTIRLLFPEYPKGVLEEQYVHFYSKMKFMDTLSQDIRLYQNKFPHLSYEMIKNYYLAFLSDLEEYRRELPVRRLKLPLVVIIKIFQYLDFTDLIKFASVNFQIYKHFLSFPYIAQRLKWEREHHRWINLKMIRNEYRELVYHCDDPMEEIYKNQIILKRNLPRINPLLGSTTGKHALSRASGWYIYNCLFQRRYTTVYASKEIFRKAHIAFKALLDHQKIVYDNAAIVARRYGFIHLFRVLPWCFTEEQIKAEVDLHTYLSDEIVQESQNQMPSFDELSNQDTTTSDRKSISLVRKKVTEETDEPGDHQERSEVDDSSHKVEFKPLRRKIDN